MNYTDESLATLINDVDQAFNAHLKKAESQNEEVLAKSEEEVQYQEELSQDEDLEKSEGENFDYDEEDYANMDDLYSSMTKSEQIAHFESIKKTLNIEEDSMNKSESSENELKKAEEMYKSEIEAKDAEIEDLKKSVTKLTSAMSDFLKRSKAPQRKAITKVGFMAKNEGNTEESKDDNGIDVTKLTKSEISKKLTSKIRGGLEKSERDKIDQYYDGQLKIDGIKHLL